MSNSKEQILAALRKQLPQATELPSLKQGWIEYGDLVAQFSQVLQTVGGLVHVTTSLEETNQRIQALVEELPARKICSLVTGFGQPTFEMSTVTDPHELEDVDLAILPGTLGVAENGAIWVQGADLHQRTILFIAQHVVLVLSPARLVHNMHQAYEQLDWEKSDFGVFVSGPSKTADIEQSLVIGAHGARSLTVLLKDF